MQNASAAIDTSNPSQGGLQNICGASDLVKIYGSGATQVTALNKVTVDFQKGSFTAIMGPSGSGKSTLMHCLAGLDGATSGTIYLADQEITKLNDKKLTLVRRNKVGFIFQSFNLMPTLNAYQNIVLPVQLAGHKIDNDLLQHIVQSLGLEERLKHLPAELSGGQQQRVAIARALITQPEVIFADEPTGALDSKNARQLLSYLQQCSRDLGQTIIMVTHDPIAASYADRALILSDGQIVSDMSDPTTDGVMEFMKRFEEVNI